MGTISEKEVRYIADLARICLTDVEIQPLANDLASILAYIHQLEDLNVAEVQPTSHVLPLKNVYRQDEIRPSLLNAQALSIAVSESNGFFKVPQIIE